MSRIALVTGGTRGIGEAISKKLHSSNFTVIANYANNEEAANEFSKKNNIEVKKWDVSNFEECKNSIAKILKDHHKIDVLINNACITRDAPLHKMNLENGKGIDVNLNSVFNMTSLVINQMRENQFGRIVHISSVNVERTVWSDKLCCNKGCIN